MKTTFLLFGLLLAAAPLRAADQEKSTAEQLYDLVDVQGTAMQSAKTSFKPTLDKIHSLGVPDEGMKEVAAAAQKFFLKCLGSPEIKTEVIKLYEKHFTAAELKQLLQFYQAPIGSKSLKVLPTIMGEAAVLGQKQAEKNAPAFQAEIQAIVQKYLPAPAKDDAKQDAPEK